MKNETITTTTENEIENGNEIKTELENRNMTVEDIDDQIEKEITELKMESMAQEVFERSLEQFWDDELVVPSTNNLGSPSESHSDTRSLFNSEESLRLTSETELSTSASKKKVKSKFRIPKSRSTTNYSSVRSRYMDIFVKKME